MADDITVEVGTDSAFAKLDRIKTGLDHAAHQGVSDAMDIVQRAISENLRLTSHPPGTPTPSMPGAPPSLITGNLLRSVEQYGPFFESEHSATGYVGPTAVQARIQELGGDTGRNHASHLPPRPYVRPAAEESKPAIEQRFHELVREAAEGRA